VEVQAQARWVRSAPRKVRFVADTLRGLTVADALVACQFMPKAAARDVAKVIRSAQANAEHNFNLDKDDLVLKELRVEAGPILKRGQPRAMGRLFSIFKRTTHITAVVEDRPGVGSSRRRETSGLPRAPQAPSRGTTAPAAPATPAPRARAAAPSAPAAQAEPAPAPRRTRRPKQDDAGSPKQDKKEKKTK
jgi:large subunit ribosomal protein L22